MSESATPLAEIVRYLRHFGERPACYIKPVDVDHARSYLSGIHAVAHCLVGPIETVWDAVVASRGWSDSSAGLVNHIEPLAARMRERGLNDREVIAELAEIYALTFEHWLPASDG